MRYAFLQEKIKIMCNSAFFFMLYVFLSNWGSFVFIKWT